MPIKIDIKTEKIALRPGEQFLRVAEHPPLMPCWMAEGEEPAADCLSVKRRTYRLHRLCHPIRGEKDFLVEENDKEIFDLLVQITSDDLERYVGKRVVDAQNVAEKEGQMGERRRIAALPWWMRLLKKFDED